MSNCYIVFFVGHGTAKRQTSDKSACDESLLVRFSPITGQYGPAVDMWSVGCIVAELLTKGAVFPGKSESDQLSLIFDTCGTPTSQTWPGWKELPEADHWRESVRNTPRPSKLRERFSK